MYSHKKGTSLSLDDIVKKVESHNTKIVEITGGEPLLQPNSSDLMKKFIQKGFTVLLETNGTFSVADVPGEVIKIIDVKSPGSGMFGKHDESNLSLMTEKDQLKLVLADRNDYIWAKNLIAKIGKDRKYKILISAVFESLPLSDLADWMTEDSIDARLNVQIHKFIWGPESRK